MTTRSTGWIASKDNYAVPVMFNPYTGEPRDVRDVQSDPQGILIVPPGKVEMLAVAPTPPAQAADSVLKDAARLERERICAAIKAEDDYCVDQGDYMLDSDDCIKIVRGEWVRPDFAIDTARKQGGST